MPRRKQQPRSHFAPGEIISCIRITKQNHISLNDDLRAYMEIDVGDWITVIQGADSGTIIFEKYEGEYDESE